MTSKSSATINFWWNVESGLDTGEYLAFDTDTSSGWIQKAVLCRKEILDPKVKEMEEKLKKIKD
ncbi:MAG: hypothetical protein GWN55_17140 [Phycisphaerae bacterium]|nr:hypothetical protein [Phycisphaerae bacterium]NIR68235.1 hypothetical protein [candidate division Zixibacteria bacterium]NIP55946.1 hypothetical protein [Phycisphaerae bacterium]NIS54512.1 hypothetical protein [Phycisphaerae bacterium]NIU12147.1 hypothetical protein [Phycisphaerae bacterium]